MVMMASVNVPDRVIRQQLASAINIVLQCSRMSDGSRKVIGISEVLGVDGDQVALQDLFEFERTGVSPRGKVCGMFKATGNRPISLDRMRGFGVKLPDSVFSETKEVKD